MAKVISAGVLIVSGRLSPLNASKHSEEHDPLARHPDESADTLLSVSECNNDGARANATREDRQIYMQDRPQEKLAPRNLLDANVDPMSK
jgi:hypothetical protein